MKKTLLAGLAAGLMMFGMSGGASADTLINNSTTGYYNSSIGTLLNLTNPVGTTHMFPGVGSIPWDPTLNPVPNEPDLSSAYSALGDWLSAPEVLNSNWTFSAIPSTWTVEHETAIIYEIEAGTTGLNNVSAQFGVDNGIFVWLDGVFKQGWLAPGGSTLGEYSLDFGSLTAGDHFLQILREDHGGGTGYSIRVTGDIAPVPEPATMLLMGTGLAGLIGARRKKNA
ncbi:MAG: PEP-CTERM sorting domain-containing protein [Desulfobulbaceae bacterium]|nr:PEP-CTERM sorting domain-containing protein [Desulfobulbaceae bacterium]